MVKGHRSKNVVHQTVQGLKLFDSLKILGETKEKGSEYKATIKK